MYVCIFEFGRLAEMTPGNWAQPPGENGHELAGRKRKRRSRWAAGEDDKVILPTVIPTGLSRDQEEQYLGVYSKAAGICLCGSVPFHSKVLLISSF